MTITLGRLGPIFALLAFATAAPTVPAFAQNTPGPAALVDGKPIPAADLHAAALEAAGGLALEEAILDRALTARLASERIAVPEQAVEAERQLLLDYIAQDAGILTDQAGDLIEEFRRSRGLGPTRFAALLRRNAQLRALVAPGVRVESGEIDLALRVEHGPKCRVRIFAAPTRERVLSVRDALAAAPSGITLAFAETAMSQSTDPTAPVGGLLPTISPQDPALAPAIRAALVSLAPGQMSDALALERGFAIVLLESTTPGTSPTDADRAAAQHRLQRRAERRAMDRLARELVAGAKVTVFDHAARWSWEGRPR